MSQITSEFVNDCDGKLADNMIDMNMFHKQTKKINIKFLTRIALAAFALILCDSGSSKTTQGGDSHVALQVTNIIQILIRAPDIMWDQATA